MVLSVMKLSPKNQMFTKCSLQIFFPRDTSIPHFLLWHSSTRSFSRWLGHNFCGFSPYPTAKTLWPCSLKKILVSNFPLSTFWMWYMIFFRKKWSSLNPANPIQQKGGHAAALLLMLPAVLRLRIKSLPQKYNACPCRICQEQALLFPPCSGFPGVL